MINNMENRIETYIRVLDSILFCLVWEKYYNRFQLKTVFVVLVLIMKYNQQAV